MLPIITVQFENHFDLKRDLLEILENNKSETVHPDIGVPDRISKTDWYVNSDSKKNYWNFLYPFLFPLLKNTYENYIGYNQWTVGEYWFQQYSRDDRHEWHFHPGCLYNNIYYLELATDGPVTELMAPVTGEVIRPEVREGDLLIFPSVFKHRSPPNLSDQVKTVISFNVI